MFFNTLASEHTSGDHIDGHECHKKKIKIFYKHLQTLVSQNKKKFELKQIFDNFIEFFPIWTSGPITLFSNIIALLIAAILNFFLQSYVFLIKALSNHNIYKYKYYDFIKLLF